MSVWHLDFPPPVHPSCLMKEDLLGEVGTEAEGSEEGSPAWAERQEEGSEARRKVLTQCRLWGEVKSAEMGHLF